MNIELGELLGKNHYSYIGEETTKYQASAKKSKSKSKSKLSSNEDGFIMRPIADFSFKLLFGDPKRTERLKSLLSSILKLPMEEFEDLAILNPELPKDFSDDKYGVLDIRACLKDGQQIDIEVQVSPFLLFPKRTLFYWSKMYSQQIKEGNNYTDLKTCITINILDYDFPLAKNVHSVYHIKEDETDTYLTDALEIHFIDLEKLRAGMGIEGLSPSLLKWLRFLAAKRKEEFEVLVKNDSELQNAYKYLQVMSADEKQRMVYEAREAWLMDQRTREYCAKQEGLEQGIEQGIEQGRAEGKAEGRAEGKAEGMQLVAINAIKAGLPIDTIVEITNLPEGEIIKLADRLNKPSEQ